MAGRNQGYRPQQASNGNGVGYRVQTRPATPPRKRRRRRSGFGRKLMIFLAILILAGGATVGALAYMAHEKVDTVVKANTFYPGVYVNGVSLYGAQPEEAVEHLYQQASQGLANWSVDLVYGEQHWKLSAESLGMTHSLKNIIIDEVYKAFLVGRTDSSWLNNYWTIQALEEEPYQAYTAAVDQNMQQIDHVIDQIAQAVYVEPQAATWSFDKDRRNPLNTTDETPGASLNKDALRTQILAKLEAMESGTIEVTPDPIAPTYTASMVGEEIVKLADFSTQINKKSTPQRDRNIEIGCDAFNGKVIKDGEKVSFNRVTGKRTKKNGYQEALEIVTGGAMEMGVGGGICQVSSTLYNAVVNAGLKVNNRTNHGVKVGYLDMGLDATVQDDRIDFVFTNNTGADIYIFARVEGNKPGEKRCVFQIYGRPHPEGYSYMLAVDKPRETKPMPEEIVRQDKDRLHVTYVGEEYVVSGKPGYTVERRLLTLDRNGKEIDSDPLEPDVYNPSAPVRYVGVTPR